MTRTVTDGPAERLTVGNGRTWLSDNEDKAWAERFYLWFIPVFFIINGIYSRAPWRDGSSLINLFEGLALWLPYCMLLPVFLRRHAGIPFWRQWWFKFQLYIAVVVFLLTYFGSEYFFAVLGMRYHFAQVHWYLDSALTGPDQATALVRNMRVPLGMYPTTMAFFTIYHIGAVVIVRRATRLTSGVGALARHFVYAAAIFVAACFFAFGETALFMSAPSKTAWYVDLGMTLTTGTLFYSMDFLFTFPSIYRLDEHPGELRWTSSRIIIEAAAASMGALLMADLWALAFGARYI